MYFESKNSHDFKIEGAFAYHTSVPLSRFWWTMLLFHADFFGLLFNGTCYISVIRLSLKSCCAGKVTHFQLVLEILARNQC